MRSYVKYREDIEEVKKAQPLWDKKPKVWDMFTKEEKKAREAEWTLVVKEVDEKKAQKVREEEDEYNLMDGEK